jgi:hypothetical protein
VGETHGLETSHRPISPPSSHKKLGLPFGIFPLPPCAVRYIYKKVHSTFRGLTTLIMVSPRLLMPINPSGSKPPFFWIKGKDCLPFMKHSLSIDQPLFCLKSPEKIYDDFFMHGDIQKVSAEYLKEICQVQPRGPYFFGGFCLGGLVACELARQLVEQGNKVALIFLLDPPPLGGTPPLIGLPLVCHIEKLKQLDSMSKLMYILNSISNFIMKIICRTLMKDGRIPNKFFPIEIFRSVIREFRPAICSDWTVLIKNRKISQEDHFDWRSVNSSHLEIHTIDEYHENLLKSPHVHTWIGYLQRYLKEAQAMQSIDDQ